MKTKILLICLLLFQSVSFADYDRKNWKIWLDYDKDCQDTRQEVLINEGIGLYYKSPKQCKLSEGLWLSKYTHESFTNPRKLDVDHIVPLKHAYLSGGANWSKTLKSVFANDYDNLIAVDASSNRSKGFKAPYEWMPKNVYYHCTYLERWLYIKRKYQLTIDKRTTTMYKEMDCKLYE